MNKHCVLLSAVHAKHKATYVYHIISWNFVTIIMYGIAGMFGGDNVWQNIFDKVLAKKVWWICVQSNCYVMCMWRLAGFSLEKLCSFAKFAKLSSRQTFPQYGMYITTIMASLLATMILKTKTTMSQESRTQQVGRNPIPEDEPPLHYNGSQLFHKIINCWHGHM